MGHTKSFSKDSYDMYLVKADSEGNLLWDKALKGGDWVEGFSAIQTSDGGYVAIGVSESFEKNTNDILLIKTDANGNVRKMN